MKRSGLPSMFVPPLAALLLVAPSLSSARECGDDEAALRKAKLEEWPGYYRRQDVEGLRAFLHGDFRVVSNDGTTSTREKEVAWLRDNPWMPSDFTYAIASIACPDADTAVVIGEGRSTRSKDGARVAHRYTSSNVFLRDGGRWRPVLSHISGERSEPLPP
jgi:hypothetical protein